MMTLPSCDMKKQTYQFFKKIRSAESINPGFPFAHYITIKQIVKKKGSAIRGAFLIPKYNLSVHQGKNGQTIGITIRETTKETRTRGTPALT